MLLRNLLLAVVMLLFAGQNVTGSELLTVDANHWNDLLIIVPNTCGKLSHEEILIDGKSVPYWVHVQGAYSVKTTAKTGVFRAVVCENGRCTPIEIKFTATERWSKTPTLAEPLDGANTPSPTEGESPWVIKCVVIFCVLAIGACFWYITSPDYDEDHHG